MITNKTKCKTCKGVGILTLKNIDDGSIYTKQCPDCEGLGVPLRTIVEDQYEEAAELDSTLYHPDETGYIDFEEEDYEY